MPYTNGDWSDRHRGCPWLEKKRSGVSSLYASIRRLLEQGLIEELAERPDPEHDDERRRYYRLTRLGRGVATAEARRLERLLADARATGLLPRRS